MDTPDPALLDTIATKWFSAMANARGGASRVSVLFSGGLDSSLVAFSLREEAELQLVTVGAPGSTDLRAAEEGARLLGLPLVSRTVDRNDVDKILREDRTVLEHTTPVSRAVLVSTALALDCSNGAHIVCGQGADELFLGYAHFEHLTAQETTERRRSDLRQLLEEDWPRSVLLAHRRNKALASPYLDPKFLDFVKALPVERLMRGTERKPILRDLADKLGLPATLAHRPKKAFQYGSGIGRLLRSAHDTDPHSASVS